MKQHRDGELTCSRLTHQGPLGPQGALRAHRPRRRPRRGLHGRHHGPDRHDGARPSTASFAIGQRRAPTSSSAARAPIDGEFGDRRGTGSTPPSSTRSRAVDGVGAAAGSVEGFAQLVERRRHDHRRPTGSARPSAPTGSTTTGSTRSRWRRATPPTGRRRGRARQAHRRRPGTGRSVTRSACSPRTARRRCTSSAPPRYGELDGVPGSSLVATDDATAQRLFAEPGRYDGIVVAAAAGVSPPTTWPAGSRRPSPRPAPASRC